MTTVEIIAQKAGVSRGTVDRVLHNRGQVKPETAEKVRAVIKEMNFQPSTLGRAFYMSRRENKLGVLVAFREPDFQRQIMQGVKDGETYARQHGMEILTEIASPDDVPAYTAALERLASSDIRGLALRGIGSENVYGILRALREKHIPVIAYNQDVPADARDCFVGQDSRRGGACAAYLMQQIVPNGSRIMVMGVDRKHLSDAERLCGFAEQLDGRMSLADTLYGEGNFELAYRLTKEQLKASPDIAGIFVSGAGLSGTAKAVEDMKLAGCVKVIGYDLTAPNTEFLHRGTVQFLIDQDPYSQGYRSVQLLADAVFRGKDIKTAFYDTGTLIRCPLND